MKCHATDKICHATEDDAIACLNSTLVAYNYVGTAYPCRHCGYWHVGRNLGKNGVRELPDRPGAPIFFRANKHGRRTNT